MAQDKKGFVLYADLIHTIRKLPIEKSGELFLTILEYVNDENPDPDDLLVSVTFEPIKQQLKRDLDKWEKNKGGRSINGRMGNLKRWNPDLHSRVEKNDITLEQAEELANNRKTSPPDRPPIDSDSTRSQSVAKVAVKDNVNVTVKDKVKGKVNDNNIPITTSSVNSDKEKEEKEDLVYAEFSEKFYEGLKYFDLLAKNQNPKSKSWINPIKQMVKTDGLEITRLEKAAAFLFENIEDKFCPVIRSPSAFREKFQQLTDYAKRRK